MADDNGGATLGFHSDFAVLAIFTGHTRLALLADSQLVVELDVVGQHSIAVFLGCDHQVAAGGIIVAVFTGRSVRRGFGRIGLVVYRDYGALAGGSGGIANGLAALGQLVFRSRPAADVFRIRYTPVLV